ncbi:effector-associated constant component EACC1 [Streptomyces sp. NPDC003401]
MSQHMLILLSEEGAEADRVAELTGYLREELLQLDVDDVTSVPGPEPPPGARAVDPATVGGLLVGLSGSMGALARVLDAVREWRARCRDSRPSLRLTLDDDVLELSEASPEQVTEAFDLFVRRHSDVGA